MTRVETVPRLRAVEVVEKSDGARRWRWLVSISGAARLHRR